jgi:hypothetical protein
MLREKGVNRRSFFKAMLGLGAAAILPRPLADSAPTTLVSEVGSFSPFKIFHSGLAGHVRQTYEDKLLLRAVPDLILRRFCGEDYAATTDGIYKLLKDGEGEIEFRRFGGEA